MNPAKFAQMMKYLTRVKKQKPDLPDVFPASKAPIPPKTQNVEEIEAINAFIRRERQQKAGGGMLVQPGFGGTRQGYSGDAIKLPDSPDAGTKSLGNNVYEVTSKKGFKTYFANVRGKKKHFGKDKKAAENFVKKEKAKPDTRKKKKSVIEIQSEGGTLLEKPKYKNALARAMNEVNALQEKGYGNIDKIVKKYQKLFVKKIGSKTIQGKTVKKGFASTEDRAITFAIRQQAKKLGIQSIKNENIIKALDAYSKIKNPKRGNIPKIVKRFNVPESSFNRYLKESKLNLRKKIPLQFGSEAEKRKYYYRLRKEAIDEFSSQKFETFLSAPETSLVQKSHLGDLYNQYVRTGNLGYAPNLINQETLKDVDAILKEYNEEIKDLFEKKPKGYIKKIDLLNQKGTDLAAATQGYKKFTGRDPFTGKEFTINFSRPSQELDPGDLYGNRKLSELTKADKITAVYDPKTEQYKKVDKPLLEAMKKQSMKAAKLSKKETIAMDKKITSEVEKVLAGISDNPKCIITFRKKKAEGGRIGYVTGSANLTECAKDGARIINSGMKNASPAQIKNFAEFANRTKRLGRNIMKFGILPEAMYVAADSTFRLAMGDSAIESLLRASEYLLPGDQTKLAEMMEAKRLSSPETAAIIGRSIDYKNQLAKIQSLEDQKANLELLSGRGDFDYIGDLSQNIKNVDAQLKKATDDLNNKFKITDPERLYAEGMKDEVDDIRGTRSFLTKVKKFARDIDDREYGDVEDLETPQDTQKDLNQRMLRQAPTIYKVEGNKLLQKNLSEATTSEIMNHVQLLKPLGFNVSTKNLLADRDKLRGMPLSQQEQIFGKEATYGFSGTLGEPLNKGPVEKKQNVISEMENEIVGRTNVNPQGQVINPFDIDISDIGSGLRGFAAAGGGIAKEAGDRSGPPPESGPMSQGLQGLMKRVRNL